MDTLLTVDNAIDLSRSDLRTRAAELIDKRIHKCGQTVCHQPCDGRLVCVHVAEARRKRK
ncbi:MAG: hypothetical protein KAT62_00740 [Desulfuromonadales bacterium]|nr:hypothetical protein [Desulfuromonadales bacterium]